MEAKMLDFLRWLFSIGDFMSHGHCYLWDPGLVRLHGISDLFIGGSYVAISATLVYLVRQAKKRYPIFRGCFWRSGYSSLRAVALTWLRYGHSGLPYTGLPDRSKSLRP